MSRDGWIALAVAAVILIAVGYYAWTVTRPGPAVQITTDDAKVSIGAGGVSISVAPSSQP
jgi:hypothetical protein